MARRLAGGEYHDPPLFLLEEVGRMPAEVQAWVKSLSEEGQWIAEFQLNVVGTDNFVDRWEYQRDYVKHILNF